MSDGDYEDRRGVILLVFANEWGDSGARYLRKLPEERRRVEQALRAIDTRRYRVVTTSNATPDELFDQLGEHNDDIIGLHFAGHADGLAVHLEDADGGSAEMHREGLAERLGDLPKLRWLFLNGCTTAAQVESMHRQIRVPIVATEQAIDDAVATEFADRFYRSMRDGRTLQQAFTHAESQLRARYGNDAGRMRRDGGEATVPRRSRLARPAGRRTADWPWRLYNHPDAPDALGWHLKRSLMSAVRAQPKSFGAGALALAAFGGFLLVAPWIFEDDKPPETPPPVASGDAAMPRPDTEPGRFRCGPPDSPPRAIHGRIIGPDGRPAVSAEVLLVPSPYLARTDRDGCYVFESSQTEAMGDEYQLVITHMGREAHVGRRRIETELDRRPDIVFGPKTIAIDPQTDEDP